MSGVVNNCREEKLMKIKEPNFIIAGGVATGTSFLSHSIKEHPEIYLPKVMRPECGFFYKSWEFKKGKSYYLSKWFSDVKNQKAVGERSSLYLHGTFNNVARRIYEVYPNIKLVFCLRNPTERAYANYRFTALCGFEKISFKQALTEESERKKKLGGIMNEIQPYLYKERGCYYDQLEQFFELFPKSQIFCIKSEVLAKSTDETLKKIFDFLEVDNNFKPLPQENFTSPNVRSLDLQRVFRKLLGNKLDDITENYRKIKPQSLLDKIVGLNLTYGKSPMGDEERKMLNDFYAKHNEKLSKLLGWDLSDWK